ncbi:hypothetical protein [Microviridae sp.]|nr:hypothetical protein [Microviridae sp.]
MSKAKAKIKPAPQVELFPRKRKIRTEANYTLTSKDKEKPHGKSLTVPGMTTPLGDLIERFIQGREIPVNTPVFDGHLMPMPDPRVMDKIEKEEFSRKVRKHVKQHDQNVAQAKAREETNKIQKFEEKITLLEKQLAEKNLTNATSEGS